MLSHIHTRDHITGLMRERIPAEYENREAMDDAVQYDADLLAMAKQHFPTLSVGGPNSGGLIIDPDAAERTGINQVNSLLHLAIICLRAATDKSVQLRLTEEEITELMDGHRIRLHLYGWDDPEEGKRGWGAFMESGDPDNPVYDPAIDRSLMTSRERYYDAILRQAHQKIFGTPVPPEYMYQIAGEDEAAQTA